MIPQPNLGKRSITRITHYIALLAGILPAVLSGQADTSLFRQSSMEILRREVTFPPPESEETVREQEPWSVSDLSLPQPLVYAILALLLLGLGYLVYRVIKDNGQGMAVTTTRNEAGDVSIEEIEEEDLVTHGVSASLLERAEAAGQLDIAVRLLYLRALKDLQDGGFLRYRRDFSNRDYQRQLEDSPFLGSFRELTVDYQRYWFGKYAIDPLSYRLVKRKFADLASMVRPGATNVSAHA